MDEGDLEAEHPVQQHDRDLVHHRARDQEGEGHAERHPGGDEADERRDGAAGAERGRDAEPGGDVAQPFPLAAEERERYGLTYGIEVMLHTPTNSVLGSFGDLNVVERFYRTIPFIAGFAVEINETDLFDDIVLPFPSYLERFDFNAGTATRQLGPCGQDDWFWQVRQPVVDLPPGLKYPQEVIMEIAERVGILDDFYRVLNHTFRLKEPYALEAGHHYAPTEVIDRMSRCWFGEEHDLKWFQKNGVIRYPRDVEESYIGPFLKARLPIYLEHFLQRGEELKEVTDQMRLDWDFSDYTPFSEWLPCPSYDAVRKGEYEFFAVPYKLPYTYGGFGHQNTWDR